MDNYYDYQPTHQLSRPLALVSFVNQLTHAERENITAEDGLYGSRHLAASMQRDGSIWQIRAFLLADMVADRDLNCIPANSHPTERSKHPSAEYSALK